MATPPAGPVRPPAFIRPLAIPMQMHGTTGADGVRHYRLRLAPGRSELVTGVRTATWGYDGAYLGPTLRIARGKRVDISVRNALSHVTTTHWHGAIVDGRMDGGPHSLILPDESFRFGFSLDQPAASLWYHPHVDTTTGPLVYAGLAGMLIVDDDAAESSRLLPRTYGVDDVPLVVQDRRLDPGGELAYMTSPADIMGMKGDRFLVNGREQPYFEAPAQFVRFRLLNGSNARIYNFGLSDDRPFEVIGSDAGLLCEPVRVTRLLLGPGERAEIVVDLTHERGRTIELRSYSGEIVPVLSKQAMEKDRFDGGTFDLLQLRVVAPSGHISKLPDRLAQIPALRPDAPHRRLVLGVAEDVMTLAGDAKGRGHDGPGGMNLGIGGQRFFSIDRDYFSFDRTNMKLALGSTEVWDLGNTSKMANPVHIHGTSFRILTRNGSAPPAVEQGWKDTVLVRPAEHLRIVARFTKRAGDDAPYMYHCHILEHEDNGMMGQFTVT